MAIPASIQAAHGTYYQAIKGGRTFVGSNAVTGLLVPIYSSKANALTLWNPSGNIYDLVVMAFYAGFYSTTGAAGSLIYTYITNAGSSIATAGPFPTATFATPVNAYVGAGYTSTALFSPAVNTTTATAAILRTSGLSQLTLTVGASTTGWQWTDYIDGMIVLAPGTALQVYGSTAFATVCNQTIVWEEVPI